MIVLSHLRLSLAVAALFAWAGAATAQSSPDTFTFRIPQPVTVRLETPAGQSVTKGVAPRKVSARSTEGFSGTLEFGDRVVVQLEPGTALPSVASDARLVLSRVVNANLFILQAPDAVVAAQEAARMAKLPGVVASYPVVSQEVALEGLYAPRPDDPHFPPQLGNVLGQWYLENRDTTNGASLGPDLNIRAAWPYTRGEGVTIAIGDSGIETTHRDLTNRAAGSPHRNFSTGLNNATPSRMSAAWAHGTECAGLATAEGGNGFGMIGAAPRAKVAGWIVFTNTSTPRLVTDERLMEMFQYASNVVSIQSHSWAHAGIQQQGLTALENAGIEGAVRNGRDGLGSIIVRPAGNDRQGAASANDDAYTSDPRIITVAAVGRGGRVPAYSEPGACILVAAPSGDLGGSGLFTTDLLGPNGAMFLSFLPPFEYLSDYAFNIYGLNGTSASVPLVAGVAALVLSVNPRLSYRDVQQILLLSARHFDTTDPDLKRNGAGLPVSHNLGFGAVDAGHAVKLARRWANRPAPVMVSAGSTAPQPIPDNGLRLMVSGPGVPAPLVTVECLTAPGPHADSPTPAVRMIEIGQATNATLPDLRGRAALIERGGNNFDEKVFKAAAAGAEFAVIYNFDPTNAIANCPGGEQLCLMGGTDFVPIPAVFIKRSDGLALKEFFASNSDARIQLSLNPSVVRFQILDPVICEHVGVRIRTDHPLRGDVRITLVSPAGTRSILQQYNADLSAGPVDWTYWSTHHFFESSLGEWRLEVSDEAAGGTGNLLAATLLIHGVSVLDDDADGLDDFWETLLIGATEFGAADDLDDDGYSNAMEQAIGSDPLLPGDAFRQDLVLWDARLARLSWPGLNGRKYEILAGADPSRLTLITNVTGRFPETEWFASVTNETHKFFRIREVRP